MLKKITYIIFLLYFSLSVCTVTKPSMPNQPSLAPDLSADGASLPISPQEPMLPKPDPSSTASYSVIPKDLPFVNNETVKKLKAIYKNIDFSCEFQEGDLSVYDYYKVKFGQLLKEHTPFIKRETGEAFYISEFGELRGAYLSNMYDLNNYIYYFFRRSEFL